MHLNEKQKESLLLGIDKGALKDLIIFKTKNNIFNANCSFGANGLYPNEAAFHSGILQSTTKTLYFYCTNLKFMMAKDLFKDFVGKIDTKILRAEFKDKLIQLEKNCIKPNFENINKSFEEVSEMFWENYPASDLVFITLSLDEQDFEIFKFDKKDYKKQVYN